MYIAVKHLIDDATAGGINRMLEHVTSSSKFTKTGRHTIERIKRGRLSAPLLEADIIVSHLPELFSKVFKCVDFMDAALDFNRTQSSHMV